MVVLLDVGVSMRLPLHERTSRPDTQRPDPDKERQHTRFSAAVVAVENVIQQKVIAAVRTACDGGGGG